MNLQRVIAVARKEFLHVLRDPRSLGMGIGIPLLLLFLFGYALTLDVDRVPLVVWDQSGTPESREFTSRFTGSSYFSLQRSVSGYGEIETAIDTRQALAALVIPSGFARSLAKGDAPVQLILDGSDANTATIALGYAEAVTGDYSRRISLHPTPLLDLRPRVWFNDEMESRNYIFPGLIAVIMMVITALLTSLTVAREWETGTMEQLISTPLTGGEMIAGKLVPYLAIGLLDLILSVLVGRYLFDVPLRGNLLLLAGLSIVYLVSALSLGMLISIMAKNQLMASQLALVATVLPSFLLSGFIFPIENMPPPLQALTHIVSARYLIVIMRGIYLKDVGMEALAGDAAFLVIFGVVVLAVAMRKFRKKIG
ncbi:ABC transporter permease [Geobacter sp. DSM 9736]|uniref:ABC transporter permease n=1 Tax=Geobacter sp. DSM 9736 TaxID=1277350 RepID=UPI000B513B25|nr:ABC transporter permease [Geobacter sp. DSM 9736]SNB45913.1 ABC-2 type transport system permease protein [Geobacter sp. DSM 9736]